MKNDLKMLSWMNPKLAVRESDKSGKGVFADKKIYKGDLLAIFGGYIITDKEEKQLPSSSSDAGLQISQDFILSTLGNNEPTDFFNHGCNPNSGFKGQIFLVARTDININSEIVFDYAMCLDDSNYKFNCVCGDFLCRKKITGRDWKISSLQKKYKGYFQYYLQEKIDSFKRKNNSKK